MGTHLCSTRGVIQHFSKCSIDSIEVTICCIFNSGLEMPVIGVVFLCAQDAGLSTGETGTTNAKSMNNRVMQLRKICNHPYLFPQVPQGALFDPYWSLEFCCFLSLFFALLTSIGSKPCIHNDCDDVVSYVNHCTMSRARTFVAVPLRGVFCKCNISDGYRPCRLKREWYCMPNKRRTCTMTATTAMDVRARVCWTWICGACRASLSFSIASSRSCVLLGTVS